MRSSGLESLTLLPLIATRWPQRFCPPTGHAPASNSGRASSEAPSGCREHEAAQEHGSAMNSRTRGPSAGLRLRAQPKVPAPELSALARLGWPVVPPDGLALLVRRHVGRGPG